MGAYVRRNRIPEEDRFVVAFKRKGFYYERLLRILMNMQGNRKGHRGYSDIE